MDSAVAAGINFFDTAASYGGGRSERWIGRWRAERDAPVLLSTKVYWSVRGDPADRGLSRDRILREIKGSLSRLGVERVDMYLTHEPDAETPIEETLRALDELVRAGKVGAIGASNLDGEQLEEALETSSRDGLARFEWVQNEYSLLRREPEREVLPVCARAGVGFTPVGPLGRGGRSTSRRRWLPSSSGSRRTSATSSRSCSPDGQARGRRPRRGAAPAADGRMHRADGGGALRPRTRAGVAAAPLFRPPAGGGEPDG